MSYEINRNSVLEIFENHIIKYIVKDLVALNRVMPDESGAGGCAIPQASSTFAALDLIGYLVHPQELRGVGMHFTDLLKDNTYFPELQQYLQTEESCDSFRDNIRSIMSHRFLLTKFGIAKINYQGLFLEIDGDLVFNATYFTKITIRVINEIYQQIKNDTFIINGCSREETMEKIKNKIDKLKAYEGKGFIPPNNLQTITLPPKTTSPLV
jgi:hypothetical protein